MKKILYLLKKFFFLFNIDINKYNRLSHPHTFFHHLFKNSKIDCVVDLGAHVGEYHDMIRNLGYRKFMVCVEPQKQVSKILIENLKKYTNTLVLPNLAIFMRKTKKKFFIYDNTHTSSLKKSLNKRPLNTYLVKCITLDSLLKKKFFKNRKSIYLKIDTQGSELDILKYSELLKKKVDFLQIEISIINLYEKEKLFDYIIKFLDSIGFKIIFLHPGITNNEGLLNQMECFFYNVKKNGTKNLKKIIF
tara:strand:- start:498 stop:1238 length:741 start_codon:yes stop_codon:yes gene_type:complete